MAISPTGNPNMRWDIKEAKEIHRLIGDKSFVVEGEDRYEVERDEFTRPPPPPPPPPPPSAASQPVPLLLGQQTQPTQPTQPLLLGQPTQPTQLESQHVVRPPEEVSTITTSKKRQYCKGNDSKMMNTIAQVLKLQQQALEQQQRYQEKADEERKVMMQVLVAHVGRPSSAGGTSGSGSGGAGRTRLTSPPPTTTSGGSSGRAGLSGPITPQLTTPQLTIVTEGGKAQKESQQSPAARLQQ
eukprot:jgi/Psemu1/62272/gm1.62272_g